MLCTLPRTPCYVCAPSTSLHGRSWTFWWFAVDYGVTFVNVRCRSIGVVGVLGVGKFVDERCSFVALVLFGLVKVAFGRRPGVCSLKKASTFAACLHLASCQYLLRLAPYILRSSRRVSIFCTGGMPCGYLCALPLPSNLPHFLSCSHNPLTQADVASPAQHVVVTKSGRKPVFSRVHRGIILRDKR